MNTKISVLIVLFFLYQPVFADSLETSAGSSSKTNKLVFSAGYSYSSGLIPTYGVLLQGGIQRHKNIFCGMLNFGGAENTFINHGLTSSGQIVDIGAVKLVRIMIGAAGIWYYELLKAGNLVSIHSGMGLGIWWLYDYLDTGDSDQPTNNHLEFFSLRLKELIGGSIVCGYFEQAAVMNFKVLTPQLVFGVQITI